MRVLPSDYPIIFSDRDIAQTVAGQRGKIDFMVGEPADDAILVMPTEDMVEHIYRNVHVPPVTTSKVGQSKVPFAIGRWQDDNRNSHILENGFKFEVGFPFTGASGMFSHYAGERPARQLRAKRDGGSYEGEILIAVYGESLTADVVKTEFEHEINDIITYMEGITKQVTAFNDSIRDHARGLVNKRKDQILAARNIAKSLGYEMQRRADAPPTYITQELQRVIRPRLIASVQEGVRFEPEPSIDETEYAHILAVMSGMSLMMERSPRTFTKLKEEEIRDHFLLQLNGHYRGNATGETFNRRGKTDILVREGDKNLFIGECKIWKTIDGVTEAIDQLFKYLTWRDSKAALVFFVKNKGIDGPLKSIMETVSGHKAMKRHEGGPAPDRRHFVFGRPDEPSREVVLTAMVFHIPKPPKNDDDES
jgi:hypothetical protein